MITIKYSKSMNEIVGFVNIDSFSLKTLEPINDSKDMIKVIPFIKNVVTSDWIELPYEYEERKEYFLSFMSGSKSLPRRIKISGIEFGIEYIHNEVGESFYRIYGHLPKYALNGVGFLLTHAFYEAQEREDLLYYLTEFTNRVFDDGTRKYTTDDICKYAEKTGLSHKSSKEIPADFKGICVRYGMTIKYIPEEYVQEAKEKFESYNHIKLEITEY